MITYKFSTYTQANGQLVLPRDVCETLAAGSPVHVILQVAEPLPIGNGNGHQVDDHWPTPEEVAEQIRRTPANPHNISGSNDLLIAALLNPATEPDENFDRQAWEAMWIRREAEMKATSLAHEADEWLESTQ